jgi:hypothetical protein
MILTRPGTRDLLELLAQDIDLGAFLADDDAWTGRPQLDRDTIALALDLYARQGGAAKSLL